MYPLCPLGQDDHPWAVCDFASYLKGLAFELVFSFFIVDPQDLSPLYHVYETALAVSIELSSVSYPLRGRGGFPQDPVGAPSFPCPVLLHMYILSFLLVSLQST
jgi:hypothetical protein